jgi:hypothetical protein
VIEHTKDCLLEEAGQCTCDAMTDEQIDNELLGTEDKILKAPQKSLKELGRPKMEN